jgi:hypothetical protein
VRLCVRVLLACYTGGLVAYNFIGMSISHTLGVMSRTVLETLRTLLCWVGTDDDG